MSILIIFLYILFGLVTTALVSIAAHIMQENLLSMAEIVLTLLFWPYFLVALIVRLNTR